MDTSDDLRCEACGGSGDLFVKTGGSKFHHHSYTMGRICCPSCGGYGYIPRSFIREFKDFPGGGYSLWRILSDDQRDACVLGLSPFSEDEIAALKRADVQELSDNLRET